MTTEIISAIKQICEEKNISFESVIESIEYALAAAYRKDFGEKDQNIKAIFHPETGKIEIYDVKTVVETPPPEEPQEGGEEASSNELSISSKVSTNEGKDEKNKNIKKIEKEIEVDKEGEEKRRFNPKTDISLEDAKKIKQSYKIGDQIKTKLEIPAAFGRVAAQTAKQVITQHLKEAEKQALLKEFKEKENTLITGVIQRIERNTVLVDLDRLTGVLPVEEQLKYENYIPGRRMKFLVLSVEEGAKGPRVILSRTQPSIIREFFKIEIPEVQDGVVEIKSISREAGSRSKIAVSSTQENIDPIGSCVGQKGSRVQTIIAELGGEKLDIIKYDKDPIKFISNALAPAKVVDIELDEKNKIAIVKVKPDQFSLAIGKGGQNVRLASHLTGWQIEIKEQTDESAIAEVQKGKEKVKEIKKGEEDKKGEKVKKEKIAKKKVVKKKKSDGKKEDEAKKIIKKQR